MSSSGGGSSGRDPSHQGIRITLPNPNAPPKQPSPGNAGGQYPFPNSPYSNTQSKPHSSKSHGSPFPSPAHILSQSPSPHQDAYLNAPPNFHSLQYSGSNVNSSSYSSPTSSPESSPRIGAREVPYPLPSLNISLPSINNQNAPPPSARSLNSSTYQSSAYPNPVSFVSSSGSSRSLKDSTGTLLPQFSSGSPTSFSAPLPRHNNPPALSSPPASPTHDPFSQPYPPPLPRRYPSPTHHSFTPSSKYSNTYMDSPAHSGQHSTSRLSNTSSPTLPRAYSPHLGPAPVLPAPQSPITASQAPSSPAHHSSSHAAHPPSPRINTHSHSTSAHSTHSQSTSSHSTSPGSGSHQLPPPVLPTQRMSSPSIPPSPMRQSQEVDEEYEEEILDSSTAFPPPSPARSIPQMQFDPLSSSLGSSKTYNVQSEPLAVHLPRAQGSPIPFEPYQEPPLSNSKEIKKKKDTKRKDKDREKDKDEEFKLKSEGKPKRRKKSISQDTKKDIAPPGSPLKRSGGVRKKRPASPSEGSSMNSPSRPPVPLPVTPTSPITPTPLSSLSSPLSLSSSLSSPVSLSTPSLGPPIVTPIVPQKVFSAFNPDTLHQDVLEQVGLLEREFLASAEAESRLREVITSRYPADKKTLFDSLLTNFILFHPEYTQTVLVPLAQKISTRQLIYSKKNPPFYAFLTLFTPAQSHARASRTGNFPCAQILWSLTKLNHTYDNSPLSSWLADLLTEASPSLRDTYLSDLASTHTKQKSSLPLSFAHSEENVNYVKQLISLVEEERKNKSFTLCNSVVPIIIRGLPSKLNLFSDVIKYYLSQPTTEQTHKTLLQLFSSETTENIPHAQLVFTLAISIFPQDNTQWFSQHFLEPILHGVSENIPSAERLFKEIFLKKSYSPLLFGKEDTPDSSKFVHFVDAICGHSKELQHKILKIWRNTWSGKYGQEGVPSWERLSQFIATSSTLSTKIPEISEISKSVFYSFLVSQQKSPHMYLHVVRFFLLGEKLAGDAKWGELALYFGVFTEFLSELATKEVWILREMEAQLLTCIQILRNMDITSHPSDKIVTVLAETTPNTTNKNNITLPTKNGIYLLLNCLSGPTSVGPQSRFGTFLRQTLTSHHACAQNLLYLVQSRDTETRAFVLRLFVCLEGNGEGANMEKVDQGLGEAFWKTDRISFVVNALKDPHISNLAQGLIRILCENYAATPPLVLGLLWQGLLDAQGDSQALVLDMEWILARFPAHVSGIVSKIGRALFLPTSFQANLANTMNSNHFSYGYPNPYLLVLLQKINSFPNFKLPENLLEKALDNISFYPDDIQLLQFQLFEGCLDFHNMYRLVEERIATVMQGIRSTSKSVREISTAIAHKFAEQSDKNRLLISQYAPHYLRSNIAQETFTPFLRDTL